MATRSGPVDVCPDDRCELQQNEQLRQRLEEFRTRQRRDDEERLEDYYIRTQLEADGGLLPWTDHLRVLLCGVHDPKSPWSVLQGYEGTVLRQIYELVLQSWRASVKPVPPASKLIEAYGKRVAQDGEGAVAFSFWNVNMMPFVMGERASVPEELKAYYDQIVTKCPMSNEWGEVCYLTVQESFIEMGQTQRRGGLHVEAGGTQGSFAPGVMANWGGGLDEEYHGGIFLASSVECTTEVFEDVVDHEYGTVNQHGDIEHLRRYLGEGILLDAGELIWLTDRTPHEALPQGRSSYRQFFRLVTSNISLWFEEHSTPNPLVELPSHVQVVRGSKFQKEEDSACK